MTSEDKAAELAQIDLLVDNGMSFTVPRKSLLRFVWPEHTLVIKPPYARTLVHLSKELIELDFSLEAMQVDWFNEAKRVLVRNVSRVGRIVAIMVLRDDWKIRFFLPIMAYYLECRITPKKLQAITQHILTIADLPDFTGSIGSLSIKERVTAPAPIEAPETPLGETKQTNPIKTPERG